MIRLRHVACFLALYISSNAYASGMVWESEFNWYRATGATALQACHNVVERSNKEEKKKYPSHVSSRVTGINKIPGQVGRYSCSYCTGSHCPKDTFLAKRNTQCPAGKIYDDTIDGCTDAMQKGQPTLSCPSTQIGNPIDFSTGNKFQVERDFSSGGLVFSRSYNSLDGLWRHSYSTNLRISTTHVVLVLDDGREIIFNKPGDRFIAPAGEFGSLVNSADQWVYTSRAGEVFHFSDSGLLTRVDKPSGYIQLSYMGGRVDVADNFGKVLSFNVRTDGQPLSLQVDGWQIQYAYDGNGNLVKVVRQKSGLELVREYHYEDARNPKLLTGITDERGARFATWSYDDQGRGISSEHAGGVEKVNIVYNSDGTVTVVNEFGKSATYRFAFISNMKRIVEIKGESSPNCSASNSVFSYNSAGLLQHITNNKGVRTSFYYDDKRGLEYQRNEAANTPQGRAIYTEWHPTLPLPIKVTEPTRITTYTYDAQGRQLSQSVTQR